MFRFSHYILSLTSIFLLVLFTVFYSFSASAQSTRFFDRILIQQGGEPPFNRSIGDINGDGKNDIVGIKTSSLVLFLAPEWQEKTVLSFSSFSDFKQVRADDMKLGDIDDDGDLDVVTRIGENNDIHGSVVWFENPSWDRHTVGSNEYVKDLELADIDKDGKLDIISRQHVSAQVWFQDTPDSWQKKEIGIHDHEGMTVADLDKDGDVDIVLNGFWLETPSDSRSGTYTEHNISTKWWSGQTTGQAWQHNNSKVTTADVNNDGRLDVLLSHSELPGFPVAWYSANDPKGEWSEHIITNECGYCHNLQAADFDKDGNVDILFGGMPQSSQKGLSLYYGDGTGSHWDQTSIQSDGSYSAEMGDIGNDGDLDIISIRNYNQNPTELWENQLKPQTGGGGLDDWTRIQIDTARGSWGDWDTPNWSRYFGLGGGDVTGDGKLDLVSGRYFYRNPGGDLSGKWARVDFGVNVDALVMVDVDGDQFGDAVGTAGSTVYWLEAKDTQGNSWEKKVVDTTFTKAEHGNPQGYLVTDLYPGGKPEIILMNGNNSISVYKIPTEPSTGSWPRQDVIAQGEGGFAVGDIDKDGLADIATSNALGGAAHRVIKWSKNPGSTGTWKDTVIGTIDGKWSDRYAIADLNGDGRADILVTEEEQVLQPQWKTYWFEAPANPTQGNWARHVIATQYTTNSMDVADLDHDGDIDVVTGEHRGTKKIIIWENNGQGSFTPHQVDQGIESHLGTRLMDLDADGDLDMVSIAWDSYQQMYLWRNDNKSSTVPSPTLKPSPTTVASTPTQSSCKIGDIDCSGKVNAVDLSALLSHFGSSNVAADLDKSGKVNAVDLSILLSKFGI